MERDEIAWARENTVAYLKGELDEPDRQVFEALLVRDPDLREELARNRDVLDLLEAASDKNVVEIVRRTLERAIDTGASDIHLVPGRHEVVVSYRIDGALQEGERHARALRQPLVDRCKLLAECSLAVRDLPQEGRFLLARNGTEYDLRIAVMPTVFGERVTIGIFNPATVTPSFGQMGFSAAQEAAVGRLLSRPSGLIAVAGPPGSGKTTVIYSMLADLQRRHQGRASIFTIEDPLPYRFEGLSQVQVDRLGRMSFAYALHHIYSSSDPDILFVGDLPDRETIDITLRAALTGHLVLTQTSDLSAPDVIQRLRDHQVYRPQLAQSLGGLLGVRLVRVTCPQCVQEYVPDVGELERLGLTPEDGPFRRGTGCENCRGTGYRGRRSLLELIEIDDDLRRALADGATLAELRALAFPAGRGSLAEDARVKVQAGITTVEQANRALADYPG